MDFHPFSEEYPLMPEAELAMLEVCVRENGFDARFPIVTYQDKILDGRNRFLASGRAEVTPIFVAFAGNDEDARKFVELANENRRHLAPEWLARRRQERVKRVAEARVEGASLRTIADTEKVSVATIQGDIKKATVQGCTVEPPSGKVVSKDGRERPATKPPKPAKPGKPKYDEKRFSTAYGAIVREIDNRANAMGKGGWHKQLMDKMADVLELYTNWRKES